jgi:predicted TIM-barrel fold metal-dependent hydrolase
MDARQPRSAAPQILAPATVETDTRDLLANAARKARLAGLYDQFVCDVDAHHVETVYWDEIVRYIDDPVLREQAVTYHRERVGAPPYGLNGDFGLRYQDVGGRIPHQADRREPSDDPSVHKDVVLARRSMDALGIDRMIMFPNSLLLIGLHPQREMEAALGCAYNRWVVDRILPADDRIMTLAFLPFSTPDVACRVVEDFASTDRVVGYCITSTRHNPVHGNDYMRLYRMIEETGKPIAFHAAYHWQDPSLATVPTFLGMHALGFVWCNMVHMTNWILTGMPERFPRLKTLWVESGLAWVPFLMQRLDDQYLMRQSEAPLLKRLPSEYMRTNCWYSSQPMERGNLKALELTFEMINASSQLLYSSDWPHFDFDTPGAITALPFLTEEARRNILGLNAARLFGFSPVLSPRKGATLGSQVT